MRLCHSLPINPHHAHHGMLFIDKYYSMNDFLLFSHTSRIVLCWSFFYLFCLSSVGLRKPSRRPTPSPTLPPSRSPSTFSPSLAPTFLPSIAPSYTPTTFPTNPATRGFVTQEISGVTIQGVNTQSRRLLQAITLAAFENDYKVHHPF